MLINISFFGKELEDRKYRIAVFFDNGSGSVFQHTWDILIEAATCDMTACMNLHARLSNAFQCFYIDSGRCDQRLSQSCSKLFIISIKRLFCHVKYFTYKRKSIAMNTCGSHTDQDISWFQGLSCKKIFFVNDSYRKSGKVVLIFRHKARMLCCLTTDQSCLRLYTALCNAFYDLCDLFRIIFAAGNVVQEKQWLAACTCNIIYTHGYSIDSDGIMLVHNHGYLNLGSTSVCSGNQSRLFHIFEFLHGKCT